MTNPTTSPIEDAATAELQLWTMLYGELRAVDGLTSEECAYIRQALTADKPTSLAAKRHLTGLEPVRPSTATVLEEIRESGLYRALKPQKSEPEVNALDISGLTIRQRMNLGRKTLRP